MTPHPKGTRARVLLSSVFKPFAQDDEFGSRRINPMELYHNQVTRVQRAFSLRMFHRSWGLMLIQANIDAPSTLLDFPTRARFIEEIRTHRYDIVGISAIMPNVEKVRHMCAWIREYLPDAKIIVGGHVANMPGLRARIDADHIVAGEGVSWMRRYLGQDATARIRHPEITSGIGTRTLGVRLWEKRGDVAATVIPSVGCPMGCNFCATSAMFGGKGKFVNFYEDGDSLFEIMCGLERSMGVRSFFVMDENFMLHRKRALRLLALMEQHGKSWALYVFSSGRVLKTYSIEQLVGLGISWVWMGLEGEDSQYAKVRGVDTRELVRTLQSHGIRVLGSSIIGLEDHTPENIDRVIEHAVSHDTEFHQFMLYTPIPGTPLHAEHAAAGTLLSNDECPEADAHGQHRFNFRHPHIREGQESGFLIRAFERDFECNGPSVIRIVRTVLAGWRRYKHHPDRRIQSRFAWEARDLAVTYAGALWAARAWLRERLQRESAGVVSKISDLLRELRREFGWRTRFVAPIVGRYLHWTLRREERRLSAGWTYEPPTFREVCGVLA